MLSDDGSRRLCCLRRTDRFFFSISPPTQLYTLSLHDALPISPSQAGSGLRAWRSSRPSPRPVPARSEEHTSELQSRPQLVCRLLLEKKNSSWFLVLGARFCVPIPDP